MDQGLLLIDNDIFVLLAATGKIERTAELLGFGLESIRRLDTLPYVLFGKGVKRTYPDSALQAARAWCGRIASVTEAPASGDAEDRMIAVSDENGERLIHGRDAFMYSILAERPFYYLASGDKRSMIALATAPELADIRAAVAGRIICLEAVLALLIRADGPEPVTAAFAPLCTCHKSLTIFFSETDCLDAVQDYLDNLVKQTGEGFLMIP